MARRTISLNATLLLVTTALLLATVVAVGIVNYIGYWATVRELGTELGEQSAHAATAKVEGLLGPAEPVLRSHQTEALAGLISIDDPERLGQFLADRLRVLPRLAWLSYGDESGRFTGAWRRPDDGQIVLNRSWIEPDGTHAVEELIKPDGTRQTLRTLHTDYDPRQRDWYTRAAAGDGIVWVPPYNWLHQHGAGITAALAVRRGGKVIGVFTADFEQRQLTTFLAQLTHSIASRVIIVDAGGRVIASSDAADNDAADAAEHEAVIRDAVKALGSLEALQRDQPRTLQFVHDGKPYGVAFERFAVPGGEEWITIGSVPIQDRFKFVQHNLAWTFAIGVVAVMVAIVIAKWIARRITRPLEEIVDDLQDAGRFEISDDKLPESRIREIQAIGRTTEVMKSSLRSFGRYVPRELVRELMKDGQEAQLGMSPRVVSIFYSDVQGFTKLCQQMPMSELVPLTSRYFTMINEAIAEQHGTIDKFIGDGVLAFFNAPSDHPDHAAASCKAALAFIQRGRPLRETLAERGYHVRTRIGLHTTEVLIGNMGTPERFNYTAVGPGVNFAFALQSLSRVYGTSIIGSEETRAAVGDAFEWRRLDRVVVKGRPTPTLVYELLAERGSLEADRATVRERYEAALDLYLARRFGEACDRFAALAERDPAAAVMMARCEQWRHSPPDEQWQGAFVFRGAAE